MALHSDDDDYDWLIIGANMLKGELCRTHECTPDGGDDDDNDNDNDDDDDDDDENIGFEKW